VRAPYQAIAKALTLLNWEIFLAWICFSSLGRMLPSLWKTKFVLFFLFPYSTHSLALIYIYILFKKYLPCPLIFLPAHTHLHNFSISLNSKFFKSLRLFIPNLTRVISNFTKLLVGTFSFMIFGFIKILFTFPCLFIYLYLYLYILTPEQNISIQILEYIIILII
jgi:hypothetical protein